MDGRRKTLNRLALVAIATAAGALLYADVVARQAFERGASEALGVDVSVSSVRLGLLFRHFGFEGVRVRNPPGFDEPYFLEVHEIDLGLSLRALLADRVVVPRMQVHDVRVDLERRGERTNYDQVLAELKRGPEDRQKSDDQHALLIRELRIDQIIAHVRLLPELGTVPDAQKLTGLENITVRVPEIVLRDVHSAGDLSQVAERITDLVTAAVITSVAKHATDLPMGMASELANVSASLGGTSLQIIGKVTQVGGDALGDTVELALGREAGVATRAIGRMAGEALNDLDGLVERAAK